MRRTHIVFTILFMVICVTSCVSTSPVRFAAIGDTPYHESESELLLLSETLEHIARQNIPFVIHVGDIFRGWTPCSRDLYEFRARVFLRSPVPFLVTIGDNEFNDCFDPVAAQDYFREIILGNPPVNQAVTGFDNTTEPLQLTRQARMIENAAWQYRNIAFIMFVLPDLPGNYPLSKNQISAMLEANTIFLREHFHHAAQNKRDAIVLITHSEPALCQVPGCAMFNAMIEQEMKRFTKPVLLINGSNHSRTFVDGGYKGNPIWWHIRPGNTPEENWPEISFSPSTKRFSVKWLKGPAGEE